MRWSILLVVALMSCEHGEGGAIFCLRDGDIHSPGDFFPAGDGCNSCTCDADGHVTCSNDTCVDGGQGDGGIDLCAPSGFCTDGVECGGTCCGPGESCLQQQCTCGGGPACSQMGTGDACVTGGPAEVGNRCGSICCGVTQPCPV